jgi:hypothetical protein
MKGTATSGQRFILALLCVFFLVDLTSIAAYSQNSQGTILGHVQDPSGSAVAGANVTATNVNTSVTNHFTTNNVGDYLFVDMMPSIYQVKVERVGFMAEVSGDLIL